MSKTLKWFCDECSEVVENNFKLVDKLKESVNQIQVSIEAISKSVKILESKSCEPEKLKHDILQEYSDRLSKQNNIILFNLPELKTKSAQDNVLCDTEKINDLCSLVCPEAVSQIYSIIRIGKVSEKIRPIKIVFRSNYFFNDFFKNLKVLRNSNFS